MNRRDFLKQAAITAAVTLPNLNFKAIAQDNLQRPSKGKRVLIVGAGLSGLSAGYELTKAGHEVFILEARSRPGGRVHTIRDVFPDGLYAEGGAMNVFDNHTWTLKYIKEFNLQLDPVPSSNLKSVLYLQNKRIETEPGKVVPYPFTLNADERNVARRELWDRYVGPAIKEIGDYTATTWPPASLKKYDDITFYEFLRKQGASTGAADLLGLGGMGGLGDGVKSVSALVLLREAANRAALHTNYMIRGGADLLPRGFAEKLKDKIQYGMPVTAITTSGKDGVRAFYSNGFSSGTFTCDRLILTVPFSVLRNITVEPSFSPEKQRAIAEMPYTSVTRTFLQTRQKFWLSEGFSGSATTDVGNTMVFENAPTQTGARGILEAYMGGPIARDIMKIAPSRRIEWATNIVAKAYPSIRTHLETGLVKCWDEDEWARGGYAWYKPGQMTSLLPHVAKSEGRIHFAGEHTSSLFGWMQGALESGNRVAREVNDAD